MWWLGDWIRLILHQLPVASKEPEKGKNYFGLYLLVGGRKPYTIWNQIYQRLSRKDPRNVPGRAAAPATNVAVTAMPAGRNTAVAYPGAAARRRPSRPVTI